VSVLVAALLAIRVATGAVAQGPETTAMPSDDASAHATLPTRPPKPVGWRFVGSGAGDLRLALPPDLLVADASGAIFANEPPAEFGGWVQLVAEGPRTAEPQPDPGQSLERWLLDRWLFGEHVVGSGTTRAVLLPAGPAVEWRGSIEADPVRTLILYAIETPDGVALLAVDGPPEAMEVRARDIELITQLLETPPLPA
jgi:hypothetical protein